MGYQCERTAHYLCKLIFEGNVAEALLLVCTRAHFRLRSLAAFKKFLKLFAYNMYVILYLMSDSM
jgi:hypothetical protein